MRLRLYPALAILFVVIAIARIVSTYHTFNHAADEGHFAAGLEYLADGTYTYEWQHPPLARVLLALPLYLEGLKPTHDPNLWHEGNSLLSHDPYSPVYWRRLALIRIMVLPWFLLCCFTIYRFSRECFGEAAACSSVGMFTLLPPVLAHSGLATLDAAAMSSMFLAAYALWRASILLDARSASLAGVAVAVALLVKFSALVFLPVIALVLIFGPAWRRGWIRLAPVFFLAAFFPIALVYRGAMYQFWQGIGQVISHNSNGHESWLLGQYSTHGWWYFFPVVLGVKTPIGFLILALVGIFVVRGARLFGLCAAACLLVSMLSRIDLGVRHILIVYPFLAICAGAGWVKSLSLRGLVNEPFRAIGKVLVLVLCVESLLAHPDYLSYFNEIVPKGQESHFLAESDLDWGQDLWRAVQIVPGGCSPHEGMVVSRRSASACRAEALYVNYFGSADPHDFFPQFEYLQAWKPVKGWVVVSEHVRTIESAGLMNSYELNGDWVRIHIDSPLAWLDKYKPVAMAGKSIRIYHIQ